MIWAVVGLAAVSAVLLWVLIHGSAKAARAMLGQPTPEQARVRIEKVDADTETKANEVKNAPLAQKLDRARSLRDRGRMRGD